VQAVAEASAERLTHMPRMRGSMAYGAKSSRHGRLMIDDKAIMSNTSIWRGERIGGRK
jgi:hypothetical protein